MPSNLLLSLRSRFIRPSSYITRSFHPATTLEAAARREKNNQSWTAQGRRNFINSKSKSQKKTPSRIRLPKDIRPANSAGKYEVAKNANRVVRTKNDATTEKKSDRVPSQTDKVREQSAVEASIDEEFDRSATSGDDPLLTSFSSPPLIPAFSQSVADILGSSAVPTPIQALSLKHLSSLSDEPSEWKKFLLASETGSGKSLAYLLPLLQYLKMTEGSIPNTPPSVLVNPRALVLAPTHELSRQLSATAKSLVHHAKLRILCASKSNVPNTALGRTSGHTTARQMKHIIGSLGGINGEIDVHMQSVTNNRPVDVLVSTPMKALEMIRGWGWDKVGKPDPKGEGRTFKPGKSEMDLKRVECVVVDEADVLFDPDFRDVLQGIFSEISSARGYPVTPTTNDPVASPFHLILTSATIPASLSSYLNTCHPTLTRLASPHLHKLPSTLHTEYVSWTGGNRFADIERRLRRVWAEDALRGPGTPRSRVLIFCNRSTAVYALGEHLTTRGIPNRTLASTSSARARGSNKHLEGFVKGAKTEDKDDNDSPRVLITTSLLSRGLDFAPSVQHIFIVDLPRNMIDFLHRAGRSGRAGHQGRVVIFSKTKGRGSAADDAIRRKIRALARH